MITWKITDRADPSKVYAIPHPQNHEDADKLKSIIKMFSGLGLSEMGKAGHH